MLNAGASWSGRERNCCFLNTQGERFADISAISGLDFIDDGRAVALTDWDHDGDLDIWVTNRTAPMIRFLRNDIGHTNGFLSVRLRGETCNRDGIGARLELYLSDGSKRIRTLRAGEGFLAQSSKWVHFGLGDQQEIERLIVRWPGGEPEVFEQVQPNQRVLAHQGSGVLQPVKVREPSEVKLQAQPVELPAPDSGSRIVLLDRSPAPSLPLKFDRNPPSQGKGLFESPTLINLWAVSCGPCLKELSEFNEHQAEFAAANLTVIALNVDSAAEGKKNPNSDRFLDKLQFTLAAGDADKETLDRLQILAQDIFSGGSGLSLPTSLLFDRYGRLAIVYRGPVTPDQLLKDLSLLDVDRSRLRDAAVPFPGRWAGPPAEETAYMTTAARFRSEGMNDVANAIVMRQLHYYESQDGDEFANAARKMRRMMAERLNVQAAHLTKEGNRVAAARVFRQAIEIDPSHAPSANDFGVLLMLDSKVEQALRRFKSAVKSDPTLEEAYRNLAQAHLRRGETAEAILAYETGLQKAPEPHLTRLDFAWLLATAADEAIRDGQRALQLIDTVAKAEFEKTYRYWNVRAAVLAENGRFDEAVEATERAIQLVETSAQRDAALQRKELYGAEQPLRVSRSDRQRP